MSIPLLEGEKARYEGVWGHHILRVLVCTICAENVELPLSVSEIKQRFATRPSHSTTSIAGGKDLRYSTWQSLCKTCVLRNAFGRVYS